MNAHLLSPRWNSLDNLELPVVRRFAALGRWRSVRSGVGVVNVLANGWIYLPITVAVYLLAHGNAWQIIGQAGLATLIAHIIHVLLKRGLKRQRPFDRDPALAARTRVLGRYAFPSGHCMTLVCVALPIVHNTPWLWPLASFGVALLAVCRIIAGHHYPTDVLAGIFIGLGVAWPTAAFALIK
ncbi:PAP2 superfamily protein [mine drainage metagenome]|uniref:PAP2 superfamily protein n=1 Tax=mine drainage metagenome TaxID=410659 RepID=A0A1J5R6R1_9ZZZZ